MGDKDSKEIWDRKFEERLPSLTKPDPFFISAFEQFVSPSFPIGGEALDLATGLGRHALWLAARGWRVEAVDISEVAIEKLRQAAQQVKANINCYAVDAAEYIFEPARFDLIVLFYHLDRSLLSKIIFSLKPGGVFVSKMPVNWNAGAELENSTAAPLRRNEFPSLLTDLKLLHHHERPVRHREVVELVGEKPLS